MLRVSENLRPQRRQRGFERCSQTAALSRLTDNFSFLLDILMGQITIPLRFGFGLFSVPAPLCNLLAGSPAGFFCSVRRMLSKRREGARNEAPFHRGCLPRLVRLAPLATYGTRTPLRRRTLASATPSCPALPSYSAIGVGLARNDLPRDEPALSPPMLLDQADGPSLSCSEVVSVHPAVDERAACLAILFGVRLRSCLDCNEEQLA